MHWCHMEHTHRLPGTWHGRDLQMVWLALLLLVAQLLQRNAALQRELRCTALMSRRQPVHSSTGTDVLGSIRQLCCRRRC